MLKVTNRAIRVLKATAKSKKGASEDAGIRIRRDAVSREDGTISVGLDICDGPEAGDAELEQPSYRSVDLRGCIEADAQDSPVNPKKSEFIKRTGVATPGGHLDRGR
jgi:hypothetical protein